MDNIEKISLYEYLSQPAGPELGQQVYKFAKMLNRENGVKEVRTKKYKGLVMTYDRDLLDKFFFVKDNIKSINRVFNNLLK